MDRVNGRPCYCSIGAGGTPCIDRKYCDALREIERLRAALERIERRGLEIISEHVDGSDASYVAQELTALAREALQEGEGPQQ